MNANELADKLEYLWHHESTHQAATMLRQQQAEIEALKKSYAELEDKYVLLSHTHPENTCKHGVDDGACKECYQEATHPAKTLTYEEMYQLASECGFNVDGEAINDGIETAADFHNELFDFAKAILRKANEK